MRDYAHFVELSDGRCHFVFDGPRDGAPLLLIHGATVAAWEFDRLVIHLHAAGFRTLRPDLFGHGFSERPYLDYNHDLFVRQLLELLDALQITTPLPVFGHSLGAALAARLLARAPHRFTKAILGAPLVNFMASSPASRWLLPPLLGELLMATYVLPMLKRRRRRNYRTIEDGRFIGKFMQQLVEPGFERALLSMFRNGALSDQTDSYTAIGALHHPIAVLRGTADLLVSPAQIAQVRAHVPHASYLELTETAHAFPLMEPTLTASVILEFLRNTSRATRHRSPAFDTAA